MARSKHNGSKSENLESGRIFEPEMLAGDMRDAIWTICRDYAMLLKIDEKRQKLIASRFFDLACIFIGKTGEAYAAHGLTTVESKIASVAFKDKGIVDLKIGFPAGVPIEVRRLFVDLQHSGASAFFSIGADPGAFKGARGAVKIDKDQPDLGLGLGGEEAAGSVAPTGAGGPPAEVERDEDLDDNSVERRPVSDERLEEGLPKRRGRPPRVDRSPIVRPRNAAPDEIAPKKRGRPRTNPYPHNKPVGEVIPTVAEAAAQIRRRGRPRKEPAPTLL